MTLEYADNEGSNSGLSYHSPIMAQEELLLVFGSPVAESSPDVPKVSCARLVPAVIRIEDDVEMTAAPSENEEAIPVPPKYSVGSQHASQGCPVVHYCSSTCCNNHHAKQLGYCPTLCHLTSWIKTSDSPAQGNSTSVYLQVEEEQIWEALEMLNDQLGIRRVLELLLAENLHMDLQYLVAL